MALLSVQFSGQSIGKASSLLAVVPEGGGRFPVLYLLHGLSDDHTIWLRRTSIERYVADRKLIVVMPDGHRSFYVNDARPGGLAYEDHIVKDVVGWADATLPTLADREGRAIAGLSMGGYGAVMLALRHPELFSIAVSHSGAVAFAHTTVEERPPYDFLTQDLPAGQYDCFELARRRLDDDRLPALRLDCGTEDFLLEHNRDFHAHLTELGIDHEYEEHPGAHSWDYWDRHIQDTLEFVCPRLQFARPAAEAGAAG